MALVVAFTYSISSNYNWNWILIKKRLTRTIKLSRVTLICHAPVFYYNLNYNFLDSLSINFCHHDGDGQADDFALSLLFNWAISHVTCWCAQKCVHFKNYIMPHIERYSHTCTECTIYVSDLSLYVHYVSYVDQQNIYRNHVKYF